jgi:hypothetical protein
MHPPHVRAAALALVEQGLNDCEISRRLGIPRDSGLASADLCATQRKTATTRNLPTLLEGG